MPDPLDEQQFSRPEIVQWYMTEAPKQGFPWATQYMHENMIHRYLSESFFFDYTTKNGLPIDQSSTDPGAWALTHNRRDFEQWLSQRDGVEYMIVDGATFQPPAKDGIWLIRKQDRKKVAGRDELTILGTYFLIRENMYQAPSIADVVGNRLLTATTALSEFMEQTAALRRPVKARVDTPSQSREASVAPETQIVNDARTSKALRSVSLYADEFSEENPLLGEPGHFSFSSSTAAVKKRKADEEAAKARELAKKTPLALKTDVAPPAVLSEAKSKADKKGNKAERMKKRKSRANVRTPGTPMTPVSAVPKG